MELATTLQQLRPHIVVALTDQFDTLAVAVSAALMSIPLAHLQGGEVSGTIDESIRHACTKLANFHFVASEDARRRVVRLGEPETHVFNLGCPSIDLLKRTPTLARGEFLAQLCAVPGSSRGLRENEPFLLLAQHPVTTEAADAAEQSRALLEAVRSRGLQTVLVLPNVDAGAAAMSAVIRAAAAGDDQRLHCHAHLPFELFVNAMRHAACLVGNSSAGIREAGYLGTPVVNVGTRQAGRVRPRNVVDTDYDAGRIAEAIAAQTRHGPYEVEELYGSGDSGRRIAAVLAEVELTGTQKQITY
jgi:UDP-hydrolysing UDP-N-acetyl-D-glucosamine 2-epimerase